MLYLPLGKWEKQGGVLLMGYEMYRILAMYTPSLVNNTKLTGSKRKKNTNTTEVIDLDEEQKNMDLLLGKYDVKFVDTVLFCSTFSIFRISFKMLQHEFPRNPEISV